MYQYVQQLTSLKDNSTAIKQEEYILDEMRKL